MSDNGAINEALAEVYAQNARIAALEAQNAALAGIVKIVSLRPCACMTEPEATDAERDEAKCLSCRGREYLSTNVSHLAALDAARRERARPGEGKRSRLRVTERRAS